MGSLCLLWLSLAMVTAHQWKVQSVPGEWIVGYRGYYNASERIAILESALGNSHTQGWMEVRRNSGGSVGGVEDIDDDDNGDHMGDLGHSHVLRSHHSVGLERSDFSVIRLVSWVHEGRLLSSLRALPGVKWVAPQNRIEDGLAAASASSSGDAAPEGDGGRAQRTPTVVAAKLGAYQLWKQGYTGAGIKVVVFDTGVCKHWHRSFRSVVDRRDWTNEKRIDDFIGHGTFVAGMVASLNVQCMGMAPHAQLHIYRVFTSKRLSFTSWFLDAFNFAMASGMEVLNLSIGGPDFLDRPFTEKVQEVTAHGIIMVSAIGNDGPIYGTLNNPADMSSVIGVGGMGFRGNLAYFSSRGMTTWELPYGYGRVKPDIVTYATQLKGPDRDGACTEQTGTSMASPVVAGAVALILSALSSEQRAQVVNPASVKQVLLQSALRLRRANIFEQGSGRLHVAGAVKLMRSYVPHVSFHPPAFDTLDCPYFWPYCEQPLYFSSQPLVFNATILNGLAVTGRLEGSPVWEAGINGDALMLSFDWPEYIWPWSGYLGIRVRVTERARALSDIAEGTVIITVVSPHNKRSTARLPFRVKIIPTPPRNRRLLWDQYHSARYPPGYFPRDDLLYLSSPFDWNADHIHTNFRALYRFARKHGYFVEVLGEPWSCFDASLYGALLVVDPEEEFWEEEQQKLAQDIRTRGLSIAVFADWYNVPLMKKVRFFDQNTQQHWTPVTGGANLPALNEFLEQFGILFTTEVVRGPVTISGFSFDYMSGSTLGAFPAGGYVLRAQGLSNATAETLDLPGDHAIPSAQPIAGWVQLEGQLAGRIFVIGDSSFVDGAGRHADSGSFEKAGHRGYFVLEDVLAFLSGRDMPAHQVLPGSGAAILKTPLMRMTEELTPRRLNIGALMQFSKLLHQKQSRVPVLEACAPDGKWVIGSPNDKRIDWDVLRTARTQKLALEVALSESEMAEIVANVVPPSSKAWGVLAGLEEASQDAWQLYLKAGLGMLGAAVGLVFLHGTFYGNRIFDRTGGSQKQAFSRGEFPF